MSTPATQSVRMPTVGQMAIQAGCPTHRIIYIIDRDGIAPAGRAGNIRIFADSDADRIIAEARRIGLDRAGAHDEVDLGALS